MHPTETPEQEIARLRAERDLAETEAARLRHVHFACPVVEKERDKLLVENEDLKRENTALKLELETAKAQVVDLQKKLERTEGERKVLKSAENELRTLMVELGDIEKQAAKRKSELVEVVENFAGLTA